MSKFRDNPSKNTIREQWGKPLIKFIHDKLNCKLLYLGLPGPEALDLLCWLPYIDKVIAFQCRDYPNPSSVEQSKDSIIRLDSRLRALEREGKLSTYAIYDGFIEEVILKGRDITGNSYIQEDIVTVYNLDFCNSITSPLRITDDTGRINEMYKSEAIRKLLEIQRDISSIDKSGKFIFFITVHSSFWYLEKKRFINQAGNSILIAYAKSLRNMDGGMRNIRLLRAYIYQTLMNFFGHCDFTPEFMPVIYYKGTGTGRENWLLHFTVIGSYNKNPASVAPCFQNMDNLIRQKMLTATNKELKKVSISRLPETESPLEPVSAFENSESYKRLWVN